MDGQREWARGARSGAAAHVLGELLITLGVVVLLFVAHELFVTGWVTEARQRDALAKLEQRWAAAPIPAGVGGRSTPAPVDTRSLNEGDPVARLHLVRLGLSFVVLEGTTQETLAAGPGHYRDSAAPGAAGNFAVAGHRVTRGAPFNGIDQLESCDAIVVETGQGWLVYRVLPFADEVAGWAEGRGTRDQCRDVAPLPPPYQSTVGQEIVPPSKAAVVAPVPGQSPTAPLPPGATAALITLTTCHPEFSARQRLVVHGVLVATYPKGDSSPLELSKG